MAQITHNISFPNDGNGDELRTAFDNQNQNNTDLYTNKVDKELGKGLSTNDYTNLEKTKLAGIEAGAQVNVPVQWEDIIGTPDQFSSSVGHFYIANSLAGQSITSGVQTKLLNNNLGVLSNDSFRPFGISTVYNPTNSQFDFNELDLGDQVNIRVDLLIDTTVVEQDLRVYLVLGVGTPSEKKLIISQNTYKNIVTNFPLGEDVEFSIDNEDWRTAPAEIMVLTDAAATVLVEGWHVPILRKSVNILEPQDLSGKLDKNIALYPTATLPLADTDKLLISQSGVFKEVAKSQLGGSTLIKQSYCLIRDWSTPTLDRFYYINFSNNAIEFRPVGINNTIIDSLTGRNVGMFTAPYNCKIVGWQVETRNTGSFTGIFGIGSGKIASGLATDMTNKIVHLSQAITSSGFVTNQYSGEIEGGATILKGETVCVGFMFSAQAGGATKNGVTIQLNIEEV